MKAFIALSIISIIGSVQCGSYSTVVRSDALGGSFSYNIVENEPLTTYQPLTTTYNYQPTVTPSYYYPGFGGIPQQPIYQQPIYQNPIFGGYPGLGGQYPIIGGGNPIYQPVQPAPAPAPAAEEPVGAVALDDDTIAVDSA